MSGHRIFTTSVSSVYPHYVAKLERKGRTPAELEQVVKWLTGYTKPQLNAHLKKRTDFETFFAGAPRPNPSRVRSRSDGSTHRRSPILPTVSTCIWEGWRSMPERRSNHLIRVVNLTKTPLHTTTLDP